MRPALALIAVLTRCLAQTPAPSASAQDSIAKFGTTVVIPLGLRGDIYKIHHWATHLPDFAKLKPIGSIYTRVLNVPPQNFSQGFPGVTRRSEWFAIDYSGRFGIRNPGDYRFRLTSDDGSKLYIDGQLVIDNDGAHPPKTKEGTLNLNAGIHQIRISYFQGPRYQLALVLEVQRPDDSGFRLFDTDQFRPPPEALETTEK